MLRFLLLTSLIGLSAAMASAEVIIIDNDDGSPAYVETGAWTTSSSPGLGGGTYRVILDTDPAASAIWTPTLSAPGTYEVSALFRAGSGRTDSAPFTITHAGGVDVVAIDQRGTDEMVERSLGEFFFNAGTGGSIRLDNTGTAGWHIADAIRLHRPEDLIFDNDSASPAYVETGTWAVGESLGYDGGTHRVSTAPSPAASATWTLTVATPGTYDVSAVFRSGLDRTPNAPHTVTHADGVDVVTVNQTGEDEMVERFLGEFRFDAGAGGSIRLDNTGASGNHVADAIRLRLSELIIDNDDGIPSYVEMGTWATSASPGYDGGTYRSTPVAPPAASASWTPTIPERVTCDVSAIFRSGTTRTSGAPYSITHSKDHIVDNDDGLPAYVETGSWITSSSPGHSGGTYRVILDSAPSASATWTPTVATPGTFEMIALFRSGANRTANAPFTISHANGVDIVSIDQTGADEMVERSLGEFLFNAGTGGSIRLDNTGTAGFHIADAISLRGDEVDIVIIDQTGANEMVERSLGEFSFDAGSGGSIRLDNTGTAGFHIADAIRVVNTANSPPAITSQAVSPGLPGALVAATATALITDSDSVIASAELEFTASPSGGGAILPAFDDGAHGDGVAGDSVYGATIPPQPAGELIHFRFHASDDEGLTTTSASSSYIAGILEDPTALTFVLSGQSNASGRGTLDGNTEAPDLHVVMFGNDYRWRVATEPVDDATDQVDLVSSELALYGFNPRHSFGVRAGKDLVAAGATSVQMIPCPLGGTEISEWRRPLDPFDRSTLFGSMNFRSQTAAPGGLTGLWWYQGENDSLPDSPGTYLINHPILVGEMREEMGAMLPIIYVQLARHTNPGQHTLVCEQQRLLETGSGDVAALAAHHMVVAFDLGLLDNVHVDAAGQRELGRRIALATREHILGHGVDGTGPRLLTGRSLIHPGDDHTQIRVRFDRPVNTAVNSYDNMFIVEDDGAPVAISSLERDPSDSSSVLIHLVSPITGAGRVTYGLDGSAQALPNVVRGATGLPAPRFGPLMVENETVPMGLALMGQP